MKSSAKGPSVRFCVWGKWAGEELFIKSSGKIYKKVDLLNMGYSPKYRYKKGEPLPLFVRKMVDGEAKFAPLMQIKIPATTKFPLVLIFPAEDNSTRYKVFDIHPSEFPYGGYQVVNLGKAPLLAQLDKKGVKVKPNKSVRLNGASKDGSNMWLRVAAQGANNKRKLVYSSMLKNRKAKRMFLFFYPQKDKRNPIGVKTLVDFAPS